jgi:hypothetical protein
VLFYVNQTSSHIELFYPGLNQVQNSDSFHEIPLNVSKLLLTLCFGNERTCLVAITMIIFINFHSVIVSVLLRESTVQSLVHVKAA